MAREAVLAHHGGDARSVRSPVRFVRAAQSVGFAAIRSVPDPVLQAAIEADERTLDVVLRELAHRANNGLL